MVAIKNRPVSLALFCKVVDNYGDIGICWRLSRQLQAEHGIAVTLWVDDLQVLQRLCPETSIDADSQVLAGVTVRCWHADSAALSITDFTNGLADESADIVVEFFGCDIPESCIAAMVQRRLPPVWLNLEGLSAEEWVEGCHTLSSPHPRLPLMKYFFFPGFTGKTGGLLCEAALHAQRRQFQSNPRAGASFLAKLGVTAVEAKGCKISLFCYPHAPVAALLDAWHRADHAIICLVPEGVATEAVQAFLGVPAQPGAATTRGALTVRVLPFLPQPDYDRLLWACDINFVRGEDSFVRAQWAGKPFIWHIYPQDKNLHHVKLRAFLQRYAGDLQGLIDASLHWNDALLTKAQNTVDWPALWPSFQAGLPQMMQRAAEWDRQMQENGDLTSNLLEFAAFIAAKNGENPL